MKKMTTIILVIVALAVVTLLSMRQRRPATTQALLLAAPAPAVATQPATAPQPMNTFQSSVKLDTRTHTTPDAEAKRRLLERLQREETRQKPQEQRN